MPTPEFTDPRQVLIYDAVNSYEPGTQPDFYLGVAEEVSAETVVDLGCGTGIVTLELARRGYRVIGVDPSPLMLEVAQQKPGADRVQWVHGSVGQLRTPEADLAVMSGHVAQFMLTDAEWLETLTGLKEALRPGGYLAFERRDPRAQEWERWSGRKRIVPDYPFGRIES
jgi:trans-aconitate methyltransferase